MEYKPRAAILFGNSSSGKGSTIRPVLASPNVFEIAGGNICRYHAKNKSPFGEGIRYHMDRGLQVPDTVLMPLVGEYTQQLIANNPQDGYIESVLAGNNFDVDNSRVILDGIPRNKEQAPVVNGIFRIDGAYLIDTPDHVCLERALACNADRQGRTDDREEALKVRFAEFHEKVVPLMESGIYQKIVRIDGTLETSERQRRLLEHMVADGFIPSIDYLEIPDEHNPFVA